MKTLRNFAKILDYQTWVVMVLALLSTYFSRVFDFIFEIPTSLIGIAVIFPLVFSINSAYRRREEALKAYASLKAHLAALYYAHREWSPADNDAHQLRAEDLAKDLLAAVAYHCIHCKNAPEPTESKVYSIFGAYSESHEQLRQSGVPANEISRANQYLRAIIIEFERLSNIANYRTPVSLRAYSRLFLNSFPIIFGPYFASISYPDHPVAGYIVAILYSLILVSLDNIQDDLENPFDGVGADDLRMNVVDEYVGTVVGTPLAIAQNGLEE